MHLVCGVTWGTCGASLGLQGPTGLEGLAAAADDDGSLAGVAGKERGCHGPGDEPLKAAGVRLECLELLPLLGPALSGPAKAGAVASNLEAWLPPLPPPYPSVLPTTSTASGPVLLCPQPSRAPTSLRRKAHVLPHGPQGPA